MKKSLELIISIILLLCVTSCSDSDSFKIETTATSTFTNKRTLDEAISIAQNSISLLESDIQTRSAYKMENKKVDLKNVHIIKQNSFTRSVNNANDTLLYIINFENKGGFAVISANNDTEGLLMITEEGEYNADIAKEIPGMGILMRNAINYVCSTNVTTRGGISPYANIPEARFDTVEVARCLPKLGMQKWGQTYPEGLMCPNGYTGCAPLALTEVLSYFGQPKKMALTYPNADVDTLNIDWNDIKRHFVSGINGDTNAVSTFYECYASNDAHLTLAKICRQAGEELLASYEFDTDSTEAGTGALAVLAPQQMRKYGYTGTTFSYTANCLKNRLDDGYMVIMTGVDTRRGNIGHAWVVDGYKKLKISRYNIRYGYLEGYSFRLYNHINWGWNGMCNGYFSDEVFSTNNAESFDRNVVNNDHTNYNFNQNLTCIILKYEN